jgi:OmpA-OmpF porin, OOP family
MLSSLHFRARRTAAALALTLALAPSLARAQSATFTVDRLWMAGAPGDGIAVWRPDVSEKTRFFGQVGVGFAWNPLRLDNHVDNLDIAEKLPGHALTSQLITYVDVGAEILDRVSIQASFPLIAYQQGNPTNNAAARDLGLTQPSASISNTAPGDLRLEARAVVFRSEKRAFKLALNAAVLLPTGNRFSFAGDGRVGALFGLATEYDARAVIVALNAAYRLRPTLTLNELTVSNEVTYGVGAWVPLRRGTIRLGAELFGAVGAGSGNTGDLDTTPLEWMINGKMFFTAKRQVYVGLGAGSRLTGGYAPDFRSVAVVGASLGVSDSDPRSPAGRYVFEVGDTADADKDGIPDTVDACPEEPGELDSDPDKIGCPRYIRRVKGSNEIEVLRRIEFEFDKSTILPESYPILDEVVSLLNASPNIKKVRIDGHTDHQGTAEYNQKLSEDRANAVMAYLVQKGIAEGRLTAKGFGLTKPRATNDTDAGRQKNRRVEFHILEQSAAVKK